MSHRLLAAGAVMALSLSGCSGQGTTTAVRPTVSGNATPSASGTAGLGQAAEKAAAINTVSMDFTWDGATPQGQHVHLIGRGQLQLRPNLAEGLTMNVTTQRRSVPVQVVLWGDALYVKSPMTSKVAGGKPWLKLPIQQLETMTGMNLDAFLRQVQVNSPADQVKLLTASKNVKQAGTESIGGVQTTHYTGTLTVQEALAQFSGEARASFEKVFQRLGVSPASPIALDLWVDGQSLPRKLISKIQTNFGPLTKTVVYTAYNRPFAVTTPPPDQVGEYTGTAVPTPPGSAAPSPAGS